MQLAQKPHFHQEVHTRNRFTPALRQEVVKLFCILLDINIMGTLYSPGVLRICSQKLKRGSSKEGKIYNYSFNLR
jgi:hypothetical protein